MSVQDLSCICVTAPTASGKTELSLRLAEQVPLEIVSMDSAMVFRGLDIGTAKPTAEERARVPHHLIDLLDPSESYSAGRFVADAAAAVRAINARGRLALIVGGTMMYLRALRRGLADLPTAEPAVRAAIEAEAAAEGWPALHRRLAAVDPAAAARIAPTDRQRIQRALEVFRTTGRPLSALQGGPAGGLALSMRTIGIVPADRAALRGRIAQRFGQMLEAGFLEEVAALHARGDLSAELPAIRSVGYRQLWAHLEGEYGLGEATERAVTATRQLAKRQLTWLRSDPPDCRIEADAAAGADTLVAAVLRELQL